MLSEVENQFGVSSLVILGLAVPVSLFIYIVGLTVYRLSFHPYAKYPGPFWAKVSYFPAFYHAWIGDTGLEQVRCHQRYGPIVRYSPDNLLFLQLDAQKDIHFPGKNFRKGKAYAPMNTHPGVANLAFTPLKREHARRRRIIGQGFTDASIRDASPIIMEHVTTFCTQILKQVQEDGWTRPINVADWVFWLSQDITTDLVFGRSYNLLTDTAMRPAGAALQGGMQRFNLCAQYPFLFRPGIAPWLDFGTWFLPQIMTNIQTFLAVGTQSALARVQSDQASSPEKGTVKGKSGRRDILSSMINGTDPETGSNFTVEDIVMESNILTLAGGDTVGTALQVGLFNLSRNPTVYQKLCSEIRTTFSSVTEIGVGYRDLDSCTYLHAFVNETIRNFPGTAFWRDADTGGATVCGQYIPQGLTVGTSTMAFTHNPEYIRDPYKFDPDRWIPGGSYSDEEIRIAKEATAGFGLGPRSCIAKTLAMNMMLLTVATVVYTMDLRVTRDAELAKIGGGRKGLGYGREREDEFQLYGSFTLNGKGPVLEFKKRATDTSKVQR